LLTLQTVFVKKWRYCQTKCQDHDAKGVN